MLWFKNAKTQAVIERDAIAPSALPVVLDPSIAMAKVASMMEAMTERGGVESFLDALENKSVLVREALQLDCIEQIDEAGFDLLLDSVFTARRKLPTGMAVVPFAVWAQALKQLVHGEGELTARMLAFVENVPTTDRKVKGAAWDFAAELMHFYAPEKYPLMCRWMWDQKAQSGALREFIRANDTMQSIDVGTTPGDFEAFRVWMREQLTAQGFYQRLHFLIDWVSAQAYADYVLAMSSGMGMMGSEFGAKLEPLDFMSKLLGIDQVRRNGKLRVKKASIH